MSAPVAKKEKLACYTTILNDTAESCAHNPFQFYLFHYFDPRYGVSKDMILGKTEYKIEVNNEKLTIPETTAAIRLLLKAYYEYGIVGIKLYPPNGYHPLPEENVNKDNLVQINNNPLQKDEIAQAPLITLASYGGGQPTIEHKAIRIGVLGASIG